MGLLPTYKDIQELLKKGLTLEAQEKIMELREGALELQEESIGLKRRVAELESELNQKRNMRHVRRVYYAGEDPIPMCPRCWENDHKLIHLFGPKTFPSGVDVWACHVCFFDYQAGPGADFTAIFDTRRAFDANRVKR
jgi:hypothetical protein